MHDSPWDVREIHVLFKSHLDLGFTDLARRVKSLYFTDFIPRAVDVARRCRDRGEDRFIWTVGSWLVHTCLREASSSARKDLVRALRDGDIVWHALPFTTHSELMDASLFRHGLSLSRKLDERFGRTTIAGKMTDVPGHTRAIVPLLAEAGIRFLHIGVNPASCPPEVPDLFVWRSGDSEVVVMYHKGTYGDLMVPPGLDCGIYFAHGGDNHGPPTEAEVQGVFDRLRRQFPNAEVRASTLDAFAQKLLSIRSRLPVITQEIGDTWIHGVGSDPAKVRGFRELCRLRTAWLSRVKNQTELRRIDDFSDELLAVAEHTWGLDEKTHLADYERYDRADLCRLRGQKATRRFEASWAEQRAYLGRAVQKLGASPLAAEAKNCLKPLTPRHPSVRGFKRIDADQWFATPQLRLRFDAATGAINGLVCHDRVWADKKHPLGLFGYELFSHADYDRFIRQYLRNLPQTQNWAIPDFSKPGLEKLKLTHQRWSPSLQDLFYRQVDARHEWILAMAMPSQPVKMFGCPKTLTLEIAASDAAPELTIKLQTFDKAVCRLPEALWLSFCPITDPQGCWTMRKMGHSVSPLDVILHGNRRLHAVTDGITYADSEGHLTLQTLDAPLVAPGTPSLLDFTNHLPDLRKGMHVNLYNNVWGTNFPMWCEDDMLFRFTLRF